jgi:integrase/recombinase XerD
LKIFEGGICLARGSITNQVVRVFKEINQIGYSKRSAKVDGKVEGIHSIKYYRDAQGTAIRFAEFAKEKYGVRNIFQLKQEHVQDYMESLRAKGVTVGHLVNVESHLQKLQTAMLKVSEKLGKEKVIFLPQRTVDYRQKEKPVDRSYTRQEVEKLAEHMSPAVRDAMYLSVHLGLRSREACNLRVEHVNLIDGQIQIENGKGVTKGGRYRYIPIPEQYRAEIERLTYGKAPEDKLIGVKTNTLRQGLKRACERSGIKSRGWHGFRHQYARERLEKLLGERAQDDRVMIAYMLRNQERGWKVDTGIPRSLSDPDRQLFEEVRAAVNQVHAELGHGDNRWQLMQVYMA